VIWLVPKRDHELTFDARTAHSAPRIVVRAFPDWVQLKGAAAELRVFGRDQSKSWNQPPERDQAVGRRSKLTTFPREGSYGFCVGVGVTGLGVDGTEGAAGAEGLLGVHGDLGTLFSLTFFFGFFFSRPRWSLFPMMCSSL
jgi:hypothetical protein